MTAIRNEAVRPAHETRVSHPQARQRGRSIGREKARHRSKRVSVPVMSIVASDKPGACMTVDKATIRELTGYTRGSAQARWLRRHGWKFTVNALGEPVIAVAEFNRKMVGGKAAQNQEPDFKAMNAA